MMANGSSREELRLGEFQKECLNVACLKGFRYFRTYAGGRTSLFVSIKTTTTTTTTVMGSGGGSLRSTPTAAAAAAKGEEAMGHSFLQAPKPNEVVFLISGYRRFLRPYVWLWSSSSSVQVDLKQQEQSGEGPIPEDPPVPLESTEAWNDREVKVWEVIAELVRRVVQPEPCNPFEIDFDALQALPTSELTHLSGGLVYFLRKVYLHHSRSFSEELYRLVYSDLQRAIALHFRELTMLLLTCPGSTLHQTGPPPDTSLQHSSAGGAPTLPPPSGSQEQSPHSHNGVAATLPSTSVPSSHQPHYFSNRPLSSTTPPLGDKTQMSAGFAPGVGFDPTVPFFASSEVIAKTS